MAQPHVSNAEFFTKLAALIERTQAAGHGAVHLSQKRLTFDLNTTTTASSQQATEVQDDPLWDLNPPHPLPLLVRATDGKGREKDGKKTKTKTKKSNKTKLSTVVQPEEIDAFFAKYAEVCKAGMQSLKKRDRSKRKKDKSKKKKGEEKKS